MKTNSNLVVIVGIGALGSHVAMLLRNSATSIKVIDFDRVETKNVSSQFHSKTGVGKSKVQSLQQTMNYLFGKKIEGVPHRLTKDNSKELLGGAGLVIDCLDNGASRRLVQDFVRANKIPCVHGALAADGGFGRAIWDDQFTIDDEGTGGAATCEDGEHLPFIAVAASLLAKSAQDFLLHGKKVGYQIHPTGVFSV